MKCFRSRRDLARKRAVLTRLFVIVDYSMFRSEWRFFTARGIEDARKKCKRWIYGCRQSKAHPCGRAVVVDANEFLSYWRKYWSTCMNADYPDLAK